MKLQPPHSPVPDPFFASLRRRHPDVDVVLLRPEPSPAEADPPAGDEAVTDVLGQARDALAEVRDVVAGTVAGLDAVARLGHAGRSGAVVARLRASGPSADGRAALDALGGRLPAHGWEVHRVRQAPPVLAARRGPMHLRATYAAATGTFLLEITSDPVSVGAVRARELVTP